MKKILVCGDRNWTNQGRIRTTLFPLGPFFLIQGGARGADQLAAEAVWEWGWPMAEVAANWWIFGKSGGPLRNYWMLLLEPDLVVAFHDNIQMSLGTKDCVIKAITKQIPVLLVTQTEQVSILDQEQLQCTFTKGLKNLPEQFTPTCPIQDE